MISAPASPRSTSFPAKPRIVSAAAVPARLLLPAVPLITAMIHSLHQSRTPFRRLVDNKHHAGECPHINLRVRTGPGQTLPDGRFPLRAAYVVMREQQQVAVPPLRSPRGLPSRLSKSSVLPHREGGGTAGPHRAVSVRQAAPRRHARAAPAIARRFSWVLPSVPTEHSQTGRRSTRYQRSPRRIGALPPHIAHEHCRLRSAVVPPQRSPRHRRDLPPSRPHSRRRPGPRDSLSVPTAAPP